MSNTNIKLELDKSCSISSSDTKLDASVAKTTLELMEDTTMFHQSKFAAFDSMLDLVWEKLNTGHWCSVENSWRKLHTILSLLKVRTLMLFIYENKKQ